MLTAWGLVEPDGYDLWPFLGVCEFKEFWVPRGPKRDGGSWRKPPAPCSGLASLPC